MRENRRFGGINLLAVMAGFILLLPAFGFAGANAQRRLADDRDVFKAQKKVRTPRVPVSGQKGAQINRVLPGANAPGKVPTGEATGPSVPDVAPPVRPWTTAGSTGVVDDDSLSLVRLNGFGVNLLNGSTGSVHIRYDITAVEGVASLCPASSSVIRTRFRNSDDGGSSARLTYVIRTSSISAGGNTVIYTFDSNGRGSGNAFTSVTDTVPIDFNFATNMYWIEATIFRNDAAAFSDLGTIQIWEAAGTACP
jgi:hypothetical protein